MTVLVYSGTVIIDEQDFEIDTEGQAFADEMQDLGFKVRISDNA